MFALEDPQTRAQSWESLGQADGEPLSKGYFTGKAMLGNDGPVLTPLLHSDIV